MALEEKLTTNVASSVSGRHDDHRHVQEVDDKLDDTGDASYVHVSRGKERTSSTATGSSSTSYSSSSSNSSGSSSSGSGSVYRSSSSGGSVQHGSGSSGSSSGGSMHGSSSSSSTGSIHGSGSSSGGSIYGSGSSSGGSIHGSGSGSSGGESIHGSVSGGNMAVSGGRYEGSSSSTNVDDRYFIGAAGGSGGSSSSSSDGTWTTRNTTTITTYTRNSDGTITKHTVTRTNNNEDMFSGAGGTGGTGAAGAAGAGRGSSIGSGGASHRQTPKIYYTSSGNGNSNSEGSQFGIHQHENKEINYGTVHHSSHSQTPTSTGFRHSQYFNWNKNNNTNTGAASANANVDAYGRSRTHMHSHESADNRGFIISTEESVNEGLDEYTRTVTHDRHNKIDLAGNGFRTSALDLGTLDFEKNNVDHSNNAHVQQTRVYYDPDLGSYEERSENHGHSVTYGGNSRPYNTGGHHSSSSSSSFSSSSSSSSRHIGDNVPTEHPVDIDYRNRIYRNKRRAVIDDDISDIIECKSTKCSIIRCKAGHLAKDKEAWSALRFRANAATLKKIGWTEIVTISSMMVSRINKLPYIGTPNDRPIHTHEVFTNMTFTEAEIKPDVVPLWVVVLSACAGAIILLLLIFLLYKVCRLIY